MTASPLASAKTILRSLRVITGLYLLAFVTSHLLNLCLGLISIQAMEDGKDILTGIWTGPVLYLMLTVHFVIGLHAIYVRPSITATTQDLVQVLSGLVVIPLLATHAVGVGMLSRAGVDVDYTTINRIFWLSNPGIGLTQVLLLSAVWVHGCAGLFTWLRAKPGAVRALPWLYPLGVAIPVLALLGYTQAGRIVLAQGEMPVIVQSLIPEGEPVPQIDFALIKQVTTWVLYGSALMGASVLLARALRHMIRRRAKSKIHTQGVGDILAVTPNTLLDGYRNAHQAHANLCSGRGRCGTCAVRVLSSTAELQRPSAMEEMTLKRINLGADVRLACQLPLEGGTALEVERLYPPDYTFERDRPAQVASKEVLA